MKINGNKHLYGEHTELEWNKHEWLKQIVVSWNFDFLRLTIWELLYAFRMVYNTENKDYFCTRGFVFLQDFAGVYRNSSLNFFWSLKQKILKENRNE